MLKKWHILIILVIGISVNSSFGETVYFANGAFTQNGIEWCEENEPLYQSLGEDKFLEHHKYSIESRICVYLINDYFWNYPGENRIEKLIERSRYYSQLEIAKSMEESNPEFSVKTDKLFYTDGNTITISGFIKYINQDYPVDVTLVIRDPTGNLVSISSVTPQQDGNFKNILIASGNFEVGGEYTLQASYSGQKASTKFQFAGGSGYTVPPPPPQPEDTNPPSSPPTQTTEPEPIQSEVDSLKKQIVELKLENKQLKIQIDELNQKIVKLNELVLEQLKVIYEWVVSR